VIESFDIADAFIVFDRRDSGCVAYGVVGEDRRWFVKTAVNPNGRRSLEGALRLHGAIHHPAIVAPHVSHDDGTMLTIVYPWHDGMVLNQAAGGESERSGLAGFQNLATDKVYRTIATVLDAHLAVAEGGYVSVDLYDGCFLYDFANDEIWLVDLDEYRPSPFVVESQLPGSRRYMAPEESVIGETIDERTMVHHLGKTIHEFLSGPAGWRGNAEQQAVVTVATASSWIERYSGVQALAEAWD